MSMIKIENLTFSYPASYDNVFENLSFQIDTDWKLGFIGRNGRGKTTLLKLLLGEYAYSGRILCSVPLAYFPYPVADACRLTGSVLQELCPRAEEWEFLRELSCLEVAPEVLSRPFETLSNGEQTKVLLAALFLNEGSFLLIDEPTNHLDSGARAAVSAYLKTKKGFILVSHNRCFLDGCVDHILSLNKTSIDVQKGNFSSWWENFSRQQASEEAQNERLKKDVRRLQQASRRAALWSDQVEKSKKGSRSSEPPPDRGYVGHKSAKMMKRAKAIESRQQLAAEKKSALLKDRETAERLKLFPLPYFTDTLLSCSALSPCYGGTPVCAPVSFSVCQGERVLLDGGNGSGKSSLLKLLTGQPISYTGTLRLGSGLILSYVPQDASSLQGSLSAFAALHQLDGSLFRAILQKMGFSQLQFEKDLRALSSGQKKKILLAKSLCERAHLYIWDEPLNYIDVYSRMQLEQILLEFSPTMLLVEHDRAFRDAVATKTVILR